MLAGCDQPLQQYGVDSTVIFIKPGMQPDQDPTREETDHGTCQNDDVVGRNQGANTYSPHHRQ